MTKRYQPSWHSQSHHASMKRSFSLFNVVFIIALLGILAVWVAVATAVVKTAQCVTDSQCLEEQGHKVGSFVRGVQEGAR